MKSLAMIIVASGFATVLQQDGGRVLTKDITDNVHVELVGARISETRGQHLMARLRPVSADSSDEVTIPFPAHSATTHETTIINIIRSAVNLRTKGSNPHEWQPAAMKVVFSIPKDPLKYPWQFDRWFLVEISFSETKDQTTRPGEE
jgi:hypothetical protein